MDAAPQSVPGALTPVPRCRREVATARTEAARCLAAAGDAAERLQADAARSRRAAAALAEQAAGLEAARAAQEAVAVTAQARARLQALPAGMTLAPRCSAPERARYMSCSARLQTSPSTGKKVVQSLGGTRATLAARSHRPGACMEAGVPVRHYIGRRGPCARAAAQATSGGSCLSARPTHELVNGLQAEAREGGRAQRSA